MPVNPALKARSKERPVRRFFLRLFPSSSRLPTVVPALQYGAYLSSPIPLSLSRVLLVVLRPQYGADSASPPQALHKICVASRLTQGIPQHYRAIKLRKTATFFGARGDYVLWIRKSSRAPERLTMAVDRKISSQLGTNLQLARCVMASTVLKDVLIVHNNQTQPSCHLFVFFTSFNRLLYVSLWPQTSPTFSKTHVGATSTQPEESAQPIFDGVGIGKCDRFRAAQPVRLPLLPFLDEVASRLLTLPVSQRNFRCSRFAFFTSDCPTVCNVVPSSTRAAIGVRLYSSCSPSFVDGCLIILL
ncbi:hypothetical protein B0H14DRAFT_3147678 [Mycena olivaceomarginata]|nr:hypothetical protein B0H14DRAFT_3147678 [Mycena olivaceomarginata]